MTDTTNADFHAWYPFVFCPEYDCMVWEAWQAATLKATEAERERCAGLVMQAPSSMVALHEDICSGKSMPPTGTPPAPGGDK
jgi:hypothetical protein